MMIFILELSSRYYVNILLKKRCN